MSQTPQLVTLVVSISLPAQQRALSSPAFHCVPSDSAVEAPHRPLAHEGMLWQASWGMPHGVPFALTWGVQTPATQVGASWHGSPGPQ